MLKTTRTAVLTVAALDILAGQLEGCCPDCCGMCGVLQDMKKHDDLDTVVLRAPSYMYQDAEWWNQKRAHVDLIWLTNKWLEYECPNHELPKKKEEEEVDE